MTKANYSFRKGNKIELYFIKSPCGRLFCSYHTPCEQKIKESGVVLCYPFGQEYVRSHRTFYHLAMALAQQGYHTLRFDFYGCGDSEGEIDETIALQTWLDNIDTSVQELYEGDDVTQICLVGVRLGSTLSLLYALQHEMVSTLVMWHPIVDGGQYLNSLKKQDYEHLRRTFVRQQSKAGELEYLGFLIPQSLKIELQDIDLLNLELRKSLTILILDRTENAQAKQLQKYLAKLGCTVELQYSASRSFWEAKGDEQTKRLVPVEDIRRINHWICQKLQ